MLRTIALTLFAASLAACVGGSSGEGPGNDDATLILGNQNGYEVQFQRADPNHEFGTLSATFNGIALAAPAITPGGCDTTDPDPLGGGCSPAYATYTIDAAQIGGAAGADVTVTEDSETFHFVAPEFFTPRSVVVQTSLAQPLIAGGTLAVSDGVASDQIQGWLLAYRLTDNKSCFEVDGNGTGSISFDLDSTDFDSDCEPVAAGTVVDAQMNLTLQAVPAQTCDGPENLGCSQSDPLIQETVPMKLQF